MSRPLCGTEAAAQRHRRHGERVCDDCARAAKLARRERDARLGALPNRPACAFAGCDRPLKGRGYCTGHLTQLLRGKDLRTIRRGTTAAAKIAERTDISGDCWVWQGTILSDGYGQIQHGGKRHYAHRLAYEVANGPIPAGLVIDHICRNRACVRPQHLQAVTPKQNSENRSGAASNSRSGIRGVHRRVKDGLWVVQVGHSGRSIFGGSYTDIDEAERAAVALRRSLFTNSLADLEVAS